MSLLLFLVLDHAHRHISRQLERNKSWLKLKQTQLARLKLDWPNIPPRPLRDLEPADHPFEIDLDLTGERSLYQLLDTATTREASLRLKDWLLNTRPDLPTIRKRQVLIQELAPLSLFRDKLYLQATLAAQDGAQWEGRKLLTWLNKPTSSASLRSSLLLLAAFSALNLSLFVLSRFELIPNIWVFTTLGYFGLSYLKSSEVGQLFDDAFTLRAGLNRLKTVFGFLETYKYGKHLHLKALCEPLLNRAQRPSRQIRKVELIAMGASLQKNPILGFIINALTPWDFYFAYRLSQTKTEVAAFLPGWLEVWYELEALNSLAGFSYLHPGYVFPEISDDPAAPVTFEAEAIGHPLIMEEAKVCNDFKLEALGELIIITGSNMAGKSSFLRTLGINLSLAYAGGPVNARRLQTRLFRIFTCIKVSDSVTDGYSYFYAEVRRLKALLDALEEPDALPLFFLIDEIFRGTNNRERLLGSRAYLRSLLGQHGVGLVSTHDLELIKLAEDSTAIHNYHFREEILDNQMVFDYKLRDGPSPTTNALKIMQMAGLPVENPE